MSGSQYPRGAVDIPDGLAAWARDHTSPEPREWLSRLPDAVAEFRSRWNLSLDAPFEPGGSSAWVAPGRDSAGRNIVLKIAWRHAESRDEALGMSLLAGRGAAELFAHDSQSDTAVLLLERCLPGTTLRGEPADTQHRVIAELLSSVRETAVPAGIELRPLPEMCDNWASAAADRYRYIDVDTDSSLIADGLSQFTELARSAPSTTLLVTDLHAGNVLAATRSPWLLIDPKPYRGDPHYDVLQHLLNSKELHVEPGPLVNTVAALNDLDADRVRAWLFARCIVEGAEFPQLLAVARLLAA